MNIGSAPTIYGSSIKGPSVVGVSATGFGLRPPPFTDTPTTDSHLDCRYARILSVAAQVPALGNKTPRALARTKAGRAKVADWLKYIENGAAKSGVGEPMATYDFTWMWQELGIIGLRR